MEVKTLEIIDFWVHCCRLTKLTYPDNKQNDCMATWTNWTEQFLRNRYEGKIFGFPIAINKKKREQKEEDKHHSIDIGNERINSEVEENLEWQICSLQIDLDKNLQCLSWSRTFCFDWLIDWIYRKSTCPNWREILNQQKIRPNKELKKFIGMMKMKPNKERNALCKIHNTECTFYWNKWCILICNKCIIVEDHNGHNKSEIEESIVHLRKKTIDELSFINSNLYLRQYELRKAKFCNQANKIILEGVIKRFYRSVAKFEKEIKENYKKFNDARKGLLSYNINFDQERKELELLKSFENADLIEKVSKSLSKVEEIKNKNQTILKQFYYEIKQSDILISPNIFWRKLKISVEDGFWVSYSSIKVWDTNLILYIEKKKANNFVSVLISFEDKDNSQMLCKIELDENIFWALNQNQVYKIYSNNDKVEIGKFNLKKGVNNWNMIDNITTELFIWRLDKETYTHINKIEEKAIKSIMNDIKERSDNLYISSSEDEENEGWGYNRESKIEQEE